MGYYIETGANIGKANYLIKTYGAIEVDEKKAIEEFRIHKGIVVIIENMLFEAAGFAYNLQELNALLSHDGRSRRIISMDYDKTSELSGYKKSDK